MREIMDTDIYTVESSQTPGDLYVNLAEGSPERHQRLYPVLDGNGRLMGILPCSAVLVEKEHLERTVGNSMIAPFAVAYPDEGLRSIAHRMAAHSVGATPVVNRADPAHFLGLITRFDLLAARQKLLEGEPHARASADLAPSQPETHFGDPEPPEPHAATRRRRRHRQRRWRRASCGLRRALLSTL